MMSPILQSFAREVCTSIICSDTCGPAGEVSRRVPLFTDALVRERPGLSRSGHLRSSGRNRCGWKAPPTDFPPDCSSALALIVPGSVQTLAPGRLFLVADLTHHSGDVI